MTTIRLAVLSAGACAALASCASTQPYNPNHLSADQITQVGDVCQTIMDFRPSEGLTDNLSPGSPDASPYTNRYRGCIATLSNSLTRVAVVHASTRAEQSCLSQGFVVGSSDLARCVLTAEAQPQLPTQLQLAALNPTAYLVSTGGSSSGPVPASVRKEQLACADVGINPNDQVFAACVQGLKDVGWAPSLQNLYLND